MAKFVKIMKQARRLCEATSCIECPMMFGVDCPSKSATSTQMCTACRNHQIPTEIAEKLGIKPKIMGGNENG